MTGIFADVSIGEEEHYNFDASLTRRTAQRVIWEEIDRDIRYGCGSAILSVGDVISFSLKNGQTASVSVAAINPYSPNSVAFAFNDLLWKSEMNDGNTNRGGWARSKMAQVLERDILPLLPDELASVIAPRKIVQVLDGTRYERTSKLWIPSRTEMFGEHNSYMECDFGDVQFPLFKTEKSRVKALEDGNTYWYWLRSPNVGYSTTFWGVHPSGNSGSVGAAYTYGVCPCFIIGQQDRE